MGSSDGLEGLLDLSEVGAPEYVDLLSQSTNYLEDSAHNAPQVLGADVFFENVRARRRAWASWAHVAFVASSTTSEQENPGLHARWMLKYGGNLLPS